MHRSAHLIPVLAPLVFTACGAKAGGSGTCDHEGQTYAHGEEFETPGGCLTYRCEGPELTIVSDDRVTIAGDLELRTQEAVDSQECLAFVDGTLTIADTVADLSPLEPLTRVGGRLEVSDSFLVTLQGLENLTEVGGDIVVADNETLQTLAFHPFMSAFGNVTIQNNDLLQSLAGADFIGQCATCDAGATVPRIGADQAPEGGTFFGSILIADNDKLTDLTAMTDLYFAFGDVIFRDNLGLTTMGPLRLMTVEGDFEISDHPRLSTATVEALAASINVGGATTICGNADGTACP